MTDLTFHERGHLAAIWLPFALRVNMPTNGRGLDHDTMADLIFKQVFSPHADLS